MNKFLMGVSALALVSTMVGAGKAEATEWNLEWGGYYNSAVIYRESDGLNDDEEGVDVVQDGEIEFRPSIVTDNGLEFGVIVQLEAEPRDSNTIDDSYVYVEGPFGHLDLGSESGAAGKMHFGAPNAGWFGAADGGDVQGYLGLDILNYGRSPAWAGDANRISYYTPRFSGFQLGASYAHDDNKSKNSPTATNGYGDIVDLGANFVRNFGSTRVRIGGVYSSADDLTGNDDVDMYGGGMDVRFAGFTIGGNYTTQDVRGEADDRDYYDLGVAYATGPWDVSFQWAHSELGSTDADHYLAAATYELGKGVRAGVYAGYAEGDDTNTGNTVDGFLVGTGFALSF